MQGPSKLKLVVEITQKKSTHYAKIGKEVKKQIELGQISKNAAKELAKKLIRKYA